MTREELDTQVERGLEALQREFAGKVPAATVAQVGTDRYGELVANATVLDFIPLLVFRQTRAALLPIEHHELHHAA